MRAPRGTSVAAAVLLCAASGVALADPPFDSAIDVNTFDYAIGPKTFITVSDADVSAKGQLAIDALVTFLTKPFTVYNVNPQGDMITGTRDTVVSSMTVAQITAAYGVNDRLQIGANLPVVLNMQGDGLDPSTGMHSANGLSVTGIGDLIIEGKYRLYRQGAMKLGGIVGLSLPSSVGTDGSQFIGDDLPTLRIRAAGQYDAGRLSLGANVGAIFRKPRTIYDSTIGQQLVWGVAGTVRITDRLSVIAEGYGRAGLPDFSTDSSPLEVQGGLRLYATQSFAVMVGGGAGVVKGIGSPESRFFASIGYAPDTRDTDGDGIPNGRDKCPLIPEDKDGFEDDDGCPDDDNDKDGIPDAVDKCPNDAEDHDGFEDDDGCPDLDNDKDGIPDLQDKCPDDPEDGKPPYPKDGCPADKRDSDGDGIPDSIDQCPQEEEDQDGFEDADGCPDPDNDGDGIPDSVDKCPLCPEDKDGFQDDDGCPDLDNDHDGIPDSRDKCPNEPETINGVDDDDGCPDTGGLNVVRVDGDRLVVDRVPTLAGGKLSPGGELIVKQMALVMMGHDEVTKWLVAVAQPTDGEAKQLGAAVKARIIELGLDASRIDVLTAAGPARIGAAVQERAAADAPPVCPANLEVKPRPDRSKPPAATPAP
ncbi:MAG TPA: thrombospondin type 3 repeat-containing protein [Kofleriaceae bacterium]|jgi:hypothetical protein